MIFGVFVEFFVFWLARNVSMEWRIECYFDGHLRFYNVATKIKPGTRHSARGIKLELLVFIVIPGYLGSWTTGTSFIIVHHIKYFKLKIFKCSQFKINFEKVRNPRNNFKNRYIYNNNNSFWLRERGWNLWSKSSFQKKWNLRARNKPGT